MGNMILLVATRVSMVPGSQVEYKFVLVKSMGYGVRSLSCGAGARTT